MWIRKIFWYIVNKYGNVVIINLCFSIYIVAIIGYDIYNNICFCRGIMMDSKIEVLSTVKIEYQAELYKIVDALNRTLKNQDLMFGLALDTEDQSKAVFTIYRT